jgi:hypothetical protein
MMATRPLIERAVVVPGHDGSAELFVEIRFPDGRGSSLVLSAEVVATIVDREGVTDARDLVGRDWTILMGGAEGVRRFVKEEER